MSGEQRDESLSPTAQQSQGAFDPSTGRRQVESPYLTAREAVEYLRLSSVRALYGLVAEHGLPYGRRGRIYLFDKRKLDRWIEMGGRVEQESASVFGRRRRV